MELDVQWAGQGGQRIGRLYQNKRGTVFFEHTDSHGISPGNSAVVAGQHRLLRQ